MLGEDWFPFFLFQNDKHQRGEEKQKNRELLEQAAAEQVMTLINYVQRNFAIYRFSRTHVRCHTLRDTEQELQTANSNKTSGDDVTFYVRKQTNQMMFYVYL
jgi:hypothetical protein